MLPVERKGPFTCNICGIGFTHWSACKTHAKVLFTICRLDSLSLRLLVYNPTRDIWRLPTTPFSLVLRKDYFDCSQRDSHAV
jgi:hypothetical protein